MSSRTTTTTSNSNSSSVEPWGPLQAPLKKVIDQTNPLIGDKEFFTTPEQAGHTSGQQMLANYAQADNNGNDLFSTPLNAQTQFNPLMQGAQVDTGRGANTLHNFMDNRNQGFDQARADQWNQHKASYLDSENPYLDQVIADSQADAMNMIKGQFSNAGRSLGSGAFANVAADRLGQIGTQARFQDYQNRYNQERANFENLANQNQAYGYNAANNLYGSGINTLLNAAPTLDNLNTQRIAQREQVLGNRADQMLRTGDIGAQLYQDQNINPTIQSLSTPMALLSQPSQAFRSGTTTTTGSQSQPNTGLLGGITQIGLGSGLLGGLGLF